jgi:hypothetical protein
MPAENLSAHGSESLRLAGGYKKETILGFDFDENQQIRRPWNFLLHETVRQVRVSCKRKSRSCCVDVVEMWE